MHKSSSRFSPCRRIVAAFIACCVGATTTQAFAIDYTWGNATTGGSWSVTTNWTPNGAPTSGDTALLGNATANRTVFYNSAASGTLTGLTFTQTTSGVLNELVLQRNIEVTNAVVLGASSGTARLNLGGFSVNVGALSGSSGAVITTATTAGTATLTTNAASNSTFAGTIQDNGSGRVALTKLGSGTLTLSGSNSYTGNTRVSGGVLFLSNTNALTSGTVQLAGGGLSLSYVASTSSYRMSGISVAAGDSGTLTLAGSGATGAVTYGTGPINVSGTLTVQRTTGGAGNTIFPSTSTLSGNGTLIVDNTNGGFAPDSTNQGRARFDNSSFTGSIVVRNGGNFMALAPATQTYASVDVGANSFITFITGTHTIASLTGSGTVARNSGAGTPMLLTIQSGSFSGGINATALGGAGQVLVVKTTSGTLTLSGSSNYADGTTVNAGRLVVGNANALGASTSALAVNAGTLDLGGTSISVGTLSGSSGATITTNSSAGTATLTTNAASNSTFAGTIQDNGSGRVALTKLGAGTLALTAANAYTGATTIAAGTLALTGGDNRIAAGGTLAFTGNAGLNISGSQSLATVTVADNVAATVAGGGRLTLTGAALQIGGTATQSLDASGLAAFAYTNAAGTMTVGGADLAAASSGAVVLPASAAITASALRIGATIGNSAVNSGTLTLGADTTISSSTITLGSNLAQGTINVAAGTVNPVLRLRGSDGTSAVSDMTIGTSLTGYGLTTASRVDLTGGTGASTLDALVTNLVIGQSTRSTSFSVPINTSGGLLMQSGTLTATTITLGQTLNSPTFSASGQVISGSLSVSGGTVNVGTLFLADQRWTSGTVTGNFRLDGGGTLNAGTIASGTGAGAGATVRTFTWNDGTIANRDASTDLSIGSGITFTLASTGTHRFSLSTGRSGTVASVLAGAGGTLEKAGAGTLVLTAVNTYTGTTTVTAGTLQVGGGTAGRITGDTLVNTGGRLLLTNVSGTLGNVAVAGGRMDLSTNLASIGSLSMTSGTVGLSNGTNLRLSVFGDSSITGGSVVEPGTNGVINFYGTTNVFAPQTFSTAYSFQLHASGNQTFSGSTALGALRVRGTGIKTVSNSGAISDISFINDTAGSPVTLKLGSNITVGATGMNLAGFSQQGTALAFGVDADTYTLDLSAATGAWTPGTGGTGTTALWTLTGTAGRIIANGFNLSSARVDSTVGPGLVLESRAGNNVANTLSVGSGTGTIDPTSVFRYAGTAAVATPSTLTSSRAIGDLEVTSGALRIVSLAGVQNVRITGGTLDLSPGSSINGASGVTLNGTTAELRYNSATPLTAPLTFTQGTISGTGAIGTLVTVAAGDILSPGNSPGIQAYTAGLEWDSAGTYAWELNAVTGAAGINWDQLAVTGGLDLGGLSAITPFNLNLITLTGGNVTGPLDIPYAAGSSHQFTIATFDTLFVPTGFSASAGSDLTSLFAINLSGWQGPQPSLADISVKVNSGGTGIDLVIVPEPGALALAGLGIAAAAWARRRRSAL